MDELAGGDFQRAADLEPASPVHEPTPWGDYDYRR